MGSKSSNTCARFDEREFLGPAEMFPHLRELPGEKSSKDRVNIHARVVVGETLGFRFAVIPMNRMVEAFAHVVGECERAKSPNTIGEQFRERRHAPLAPAASTAGSARILFHMRSKIPSAASPNSTK